MWSIPVHTGKPGNDLEKCENFWVYPRTHGETQIDTTEVHAYWGLSPYTRGNRKNGRRVVVEVRSIPVHTGKPLT